MLTSHGHSHDSDGSIEPSGPSPPNTLTSATTANSSSAPTWAPIMIREVRAESSVPITQIAVTAMMITVARSVVGMRSLTGSPSSNVGSAESQLTMSNM